jgi:cysteine-rich repeat protein
VTRLARASLAFVLVSACLLGCKPPHVILVIEDPDSVGAGADRIAIGDSPDDLVIESLGELSFPVRITLTTGESSSRELWAEARLDDEVLARGRTDVVFDDDNTNTFELQLLAPCGPGERVICDDLIHCNGEERCIDTICEHGPPPCDNSEHECVQVNCIEEDERCEEVAVHERCGSIVIDDVPVPGKCSLTEGCVATSACAVDADCDDGLVCNGAETCSEDGRCTPGEPLYVPPTENSCEVVGCSEAAGGEVREPALDGAACATAGDDRVDGVCRSGECILTTCGDGLLDPISGELCDDGNQNDFDLCDARCKPVTFESDIHMGGGYCDGHPLSVATLGLSSFLGVTPDGSIWLGDSVDERVRRILPDGTIVHVAGTGTNLSGFGDDPATTPLLGDVRSIAGLSDGTVFFTESSTVGFIRVIHPDGTYEAWGARGNNSSIGFEGHLPALELASPDSVAVSPDGSTLYYSRSILRVMKADLATLDTRAIAGGGDTANFDGPATELNYRVTDIAVDSTGRVVTLAQGGGVNDHGVTILEDQGDGTHRATRVAGDGACDPFVDGAVATATSFCSPVGLAVDVLGDAFCTSFQRRVVCVDDAGLAHIRVGTGNDGRPVDNTQLPLDVDLGDVLDVKGEANGDLLVLAERASVRHLIRVFADQSGIEILKNSDGDFRQCGLGEIREAGIGPQNGLGVGPLGVVSTGDEGAFHVAGGVVDRLGFVRNGSIGFGTTEIFSLRFDDISVYPSLEEGPRRIAGEGALIGDAADALDVVLESPVDLLVVNDDTLLVLEQQSALIRRLDRQQDESWSITTIAGTREHIAVSPDGAPLETALFFPTSMARAPDGSILVGELDGRLRRLTADGATLETILKLDGDILAVYVDEGGNPWLADDSSRIWLVPAGDGLAPGVTPVHVAGTGQPGLRPGPALDTDFSPPRDLVIDRDGNIYISLFDELAVMRFRRITTP